MCVCIISFDFYCYLVYRKTTILKATWFLFIAHTGNHLLHPPREEAQENHLKLNESSLGKCT